MKVLVVAGEASADLHASHLLHKIKESHSVSLMGVGGDGLAAEGLQSVFSIREMAVVGLVEAIKKIPQSLRLLGRLEQLAREEKPDFALLLDMPDFNLRLAARLKRIGIPVLYYTLPQVWAWRSGRVHQMERDLDLCLSILPFEKPWYEAFGSKLAIKYVGNPTIGEISNLPFEPEEFQIAILPGSRESEWSSHFPILLEAAALLKRRDSRYHFVIPLAPTLRKSEQVRKDLSPLESLHAILLDELSGKIAVISEPAPQLLRKSKAAWVASGTATLECGVVGIPMVIVYKVNPVSAFLFKNVVRYRGAIGLINLIHGGIGGKEKVVPEILQAEANAENVSNRMWTLLTTAEWQTQKEKLSRTRELLSGPGRPIENAATAVIEFYEARKR